MRKREFTYPGTDLDRGRNLLALLGSFWTDVYTGSDQINSYIGATAEVVKQTLKNLYEVVAGLSRHDIPIFHEETIFPIVIRLSDLNSPETLPLRFDTSNAHFDETYNFDQAGGTAFYAFPAPPKFTDVAYLFNKITFPTAALIKNTDFTIDSENNAIVFARNPFENDAFLRKKIVGTDDVEITLWGFSAKFDYDYIFEQFAYAIGLRLRSSTGYKELMNAVISGLIAGGITAKALDVAVSAICGIPLALDYETIETVQRDRHGIFIATDKTIYRFGENATPVVVPGQIIRPGQYLVRGFEISEFFVGNTYLPAVVDAEQVVCQVAPETILATDTFETLTTETDADLALSFQREICSQVRRDIPAIALGSGFLSACFWGDLVFENREIPLEVIEDHPSGYTYVKFGLGGLPADVEHFFDEIHRRGIARLSLPADCPPQPVRGTLAHILDRRRNIESEPTADTLPKTINPLRFLIENVLRNNAFVVRIVVSALGQNALGLYNIRHLRALIPPQTAMIVIFEMSADVDKIQPDNISEQVTFFKGAAPVVDTIPDTLVHDFGATTRVISGTCQ